MTLGRRTDTTESGKPWRIDSSATATQTVRAAIVPFSTKTRSGFELDGSVEGDNQLAVLGPQNGLSDVRPGDTLTDPNTSRVYTVRQVKEHRIGSSVLGLLAWVTR